VLLSNSLIQMIRNWYTCWNLGDISGSLPGTWAKERSRCPKWRRKPLLWSV